LSLLRISRRICFGRVVKRAMREYHLDLMLRVSLETRAWLRGLTLSILYTLV